MKDQARSDMDKTPRKLDWIGFIETLPNDIEIMRIDDADHDGFFVIEVCVPRETQALSEFLAALPMGTEFAEHTNDVDDEICLKLYVPKPTKHKKERHEI